MRFEYGIFLSFLFALLSMMLSGELKAEIITGQALPLIDLSGDLGGRVDGSPWSSNELRGKVQLVFYVDPDEKRMNEPLEQALKKEDFPKDKLQSTAVINMDATWLPNGAIAFELGRKQKEFSHVVYVKDLKKSLVKLWGIGDDTYDVLVLDQEGKVLFYKAGKISEAESAKLIELIRAHLK